MVALPHVQAMRHVVGPEHARVHARAGLCTRCAYCGHRTSGALACSAHDDLPALDPEWGARAVRPELTHEVRRDKQGGRHCACGASFSSPRALRHHLKVMRKRQERTQRS